MPLWNIYYTADIFESTVTRTKLAEDITNLYTGGGMPAFYVVVQFIPLPAENVFVAGKARTNFVRLVIQHMAVHKHEGVDNFPARFSTKINDALRPYIADKGYDWEITVSDTPRDFWRFNGIEPPPYGSEAMKVWAKEDKASEWA
jgi:hypothetical protein